jgi:hypothetical protein
MCYFYFKTKEVKNISDSLKGTVSQDFSPPVFVKVLLLFLTDMLEKFPFLYMSVIRLLRCFTGVSDTGKVDVLLYYDDSFECKKKMLRSNIYYYIAYFLLIISLKIWQAVNYSNVLYQCQRHWQSMYDRCGRCR